MAVQVERMIATLEARVDKYERGLRKASRTTNRQFTRIERRGNKMRATLERHFRRAGQATAVLTGPLGGIASRLTGLGGIIGSTGLAFGSLGLTVGALTAVATKAVRTFQEFETQQLTTEQVLRATGGAAGKTAADIERLAQSIGINTLASTTEARKAATQLLTFRSIAGETFDRTLRLAQDLAANGFGTLSSSAVQLGKALEDPAQGLTSLRRVGVSFSDQQRQVIMDLFNTGQAAKAQEKILDALEQQVGGSGEAQAGGLAGAFDTLLEVSSLLFENWGERIATVTDLRNNMLGLASAIDGVNRSFELAGQIAAISTRIDNQRAALARETASRAVPGMDNPFNQFASRQEVGEGERRLQTLIEERQRLQRLVFDEAQRQSIASLRSIGVQKQAEEERAAAVLAALQKELDLSRLTVAEREVRTRLAEAGVTAESELGQRIAEAVRQIAAAKSGETAARRANAAAAREEAAAAEESTLALSGTLDGMSEIRSLGRDVLGGFVSDLRRGTDAADALQNALTRVADRLIDISLDNLFGGGAGGAPFAGAGRRGLLGGLIIPGILHGGGTAGVNGYGSGRAVPAAAFGAAPRYHSGGVAGLKPNEVPAILERGEVVLPKVAARRGGATTQITYAPVIDARGAEAGAVTRIEQVLREHSRQIAGMPEQLAATRRLRPGL